MQTTTTRHRPNCRRAWNRLDATCPRCLELKNGAPARAGWSDHTRRLAEQLRREIQQHDCRRSQCGPVCTFGDY